MDQDWTDLTEELRRFASEREWGHFHTPKNLAMALAGEVGELLAEFQWLTPEQSERHSINREQRAAIEDEIADVAIYLIQLVDRLEVDLHAVVQRKIETNAERHPPK